MTDTPNSPSFGEQDDLEFQYLSLKEKVLQGKQLTAGDFADHRDVEDAKEDIANDPAAQRKRLQEEVDKLLAPIKVRASAMDTQDKIVHDGLEELKAAANLSSAEKVQVAVTEGGVGLVKATTGLVTDVPKLFDEKVPESQKVAITGRLAVISSALLTLWMLTRKREVEEPVFKDDGSPKMIPEIGPDGRATGKEIQATRKIKKKPTGLWRILSFLGVGVGATLALSAIQKFTKPAKTAEELKREAESRARVDTLAKEYGGTLPLEKMEPGAEISSKERPQLRAVSLVGTDNISHAFNVHVREKDIRFGINGKTYALAVAKKSLKEPAKKTWDEPMADEVASVTSSPMGGLGIRLDYGQGYGFTAHIDKVALTKVLQEAQEANATTEIRVPARLVIPASQVKDVSGLNKQIANALGKLPGGMGIVENLVDTGAKLEGSNYVWETELIFKSIGGSPAAAPDAASKPEEMAKMSDTTPTATPPAKQPESTKSASGSLFKPWEWFGGKKNEKAAPQPPKAPPKQA